eukprot:Tbor_TRINITY_DN4804_c0_g1::TRINITY_DN4804_c0_g1_i1::g.1212::m.1212
MRSSSPLPSDMEVAHLRQDLKAAHEVIHLLQEDGDRVKRMLSTCKHNHHREVVLLTDSKAKLESKVAELNVKVEELQGDNQRLLSEVQEAVCERENQASSLSVVRKKVDQRLTMLLQEIHTKDETLHKLQYIVNEREREKDKIQMYEKMLHSREENITSLLEQVSTLRSELSDVKAEVKHKSLLIEEKNSAVKVSVAREQSQSLLREQDALGQKQQASELFTIFPLYRQWSSELSNDLELIEDAIDSVLDSATDLRVVLEGGDATTSQHDRQRLYRMRQLEKERTKAQMQAMSSAAMSSKDPNTIHVHVIRSNCDNCRHEINKIKETLLSLGQFIVHLKDTSTRSITGQEAIDTTPLPIGSPGSPSPLSTGLGRRPALPMPSSLAEISRLNGTIVERDETIRSLQNQRFEEREKTAVAEAKVKFLEREREQLRGEVDHLKECLLKSEEALKDIKDNSYKMKDEYIKEIEDLRKQSTDYTINHFSEKGELENKYKKLLSEQEEKYRAEISTLDANIRNLRATIDELTASENKLKSVLEESREKRLQLKKTNDTQKEDLEEARDSLSKQNRELRQSQEMIDSLSAELAHVKAVLDFEVQQYEANNCSASKWSDGPSEFEGWKHQHREAGVAAKRANGRGAGRKVVITRKR